MTCQLEVYLIRLLTTILAHNFMQKYEYYLYTVQNNIIWFIFIFYSLIQELKQNICIYNYH